MNSSVSAGTQQLTHHPVEENPRERRWWRPWARTIGMLSVGEDTVVSDLGRGDDAVDVDRIDLRQPFAAHLAAWPVEEGGDDAWLSVQLRQGEQQLEVQTRVPWSAVPEETPFKMSAAPVAEFDVWSELWETLRYAREVEGGARLPDVEPGRHPVGPRTPDVEMVEAAEPAFERPGLGDLKVIGTSHAILTFGLNTRGFIYIGLNGEGFIAIGVNLKGVFTVGVNGSAAIAGIGLNMASPLVLLGFNLLAPIVLMGFNAMPVDATSTTSTIIRCAMSGLLAVGWAAAVFVHGRMKRKLVEELRADALNRMRRGEAGAAESGAPDARTTPAGRRSARTGDADQRRPDGIIGIEELELQDSSEPLEAELTEAGKGTQSTQPLDPEVRAKKRTSIVLHRWQQIGYGLGALLSIALIPLLLMDPELPLKMAEWVFG